MKNTYKKPLVMLLAVLMLFYTLFPACGKEAPSEEIRIEGLPIRHEEEFGGVYIDYTIDDFNALGFEYGDSVDVVFSNGYEAKDLPYYNGYYTQTGEPLLIAYPGYDYIKAAVNNGDDLYVLAGLKEGDTAEIAVTERGKYKAIQNARDIHYEDVREKFGSDGIFANFRAVSVTGMKENTVYRSASPCDNQHNRATYTDALMTAAGVNSILDLADTEEKIAGYMAKEDFACPGFAALYEGGHVLPLGLNMNFGSDTFRGKIVQGLVWMSEQEGPYLVHCTEGKDRTGFVCMLLEALAGAPYEEIVRDYMITYDNYYKITKEKDAARYDVIVENVLDPMIRVVTDGADPKTAGLAACAKTWLLQAGMTEEQVDMLLERIAEK